MRYILNSSVMTSYGTYEYKEITSKSAKDWLNEGDFESAVGYAETCAAFNLLFGDDITLSVNKKIIIMDAGDEALVFSIMLPLGAARIAFEDKGNLTPEFVLLNCKLGLLKRII